MGLVERGGQRGGVDVGKRGGVIGEVVLEQVEGEGFGGLEGLGDGRAVGEVWGSGHGGRMRALGVTSRRLTRGSWRVCTVRV